ncbi:MAG TPA: helix-turn-helix domain-containing protein [Pilimelia sp.]|nr:helix-turn-helix domain-containing protein [Pilimelia sp.]
MSDNELGTFLRTRREAVNPADVGLPTGHRRRTPGLRRSELATLAGVSVEYLTRLEQGRDRRPSAQVIGAIADALRLHTDERVHLRHLSKPTGAHGCQLAEAPATQVRATVRALLDRLGPAPALVLNRLGDVLAASPAYELVAGPIGLLDGPQPNVHRFVFTDARARLAYPEWDRVADEHAAYLRAELRRADAVSTFLAEELTVLAGAPFTGRLAAPPTAPRRTGVERLAHPAVGELRLAYEILELPDADEQRLVVYLPADEATATALDHLTGRLTGRPAGTAPRTPAGAAAA